MVQFRVINHILWIVRLEVCESAWVVAVNREGDCIPDPEGTDQSLNPGVVAGAVVCGSKNVKPIVHTIH